MEYGLLFKKTSTCYKNPDIEYLDETSDYKLKILKKLGKITETEFRQKHDELRKSISYLTKEEQGKVYAGGFLRDMLLQKKGEAPEKWDNQRRKKAITAAVHKISRKYGPYRKTIGHKMVFSVSDQLFNKIDNAGLKLDDILGREVKNIMYEFQHKFHPREQIGFAWRIHHDSKHRHVHVYLCNRTASGKHVALSNPLKGKVQKRQRKNQIGYMKERCVAAVKRMEQMAEGLNKNQLPKRISDLKIEHKRPAKIPVALSERAQSLEEMNRSLISKENELKLKQIAIRQSNSHYYLQQEFIFRGWQDVKAINKSISKNFQKLKENDSFISPKLLRQLDWVSDSGTVKFFSKMLLMMHNEQNRIKRQALFERINKSKDYKTSLLNQLKLLDSGKKNFQQEIKKMKEEREQLRKEFYQQHRDYKSAKLRFNADYFRAVMTDPDKRIEYSKAKRRFWQKIKSKEDHSQELSLLRKLDEEARRFAAQKPEPKEEIPETKEVVKINWHEFNTNVEIFEKWVIDRDKLKEYHKLRSIILEKDTKQENCSKELIRLKELDEEALALASSQSTDLHQINLSDSNIEPIDNNQKQRRRM